MKDKQIVVIDFGGQYAHLISRRFRQLGFPTLVIPFNKVHSVKREDTGGVVLSGGPASVYEKGAPTVNKRLFKLKKPILGICYGWQFSSFRYSTTLGNWCPGHPHPLPYYMGSRIGFGK